MISKKNINKYLVENLIDVERTRGLLSNKLYDEYKQNIQSVVKDFKNTINEYKDKGFKIVGYGAAAKGMTFLNFADTTLDIIIDDNPLKQNLYTPGTNILIKSVDYIKTYKPEEKILYVPLAWNFYNEIKERILKVRDNSNDLFLKYFPTLKIEK